MTPTLPEEAVKAAQDAFNKTINDPIMVPCNRCSGKGYHYGFGEDGASPDWCVECGGSAFDVVPGEEERAMRAALTAALPFLPVQGAVKKLEWGNARITEDGREAEDAESPVGRYIATDTGWFLLGRTGYEVERGLYQAKAAAQADYEARIRSAIETVISVSEPSAARELALEEAAQIAEDYVQYDVATAIRALSSPDHADAGKVEADGNRETLWKSAARDFGAYLASNGTPYAIDYWNECFGPLFSAPADAGKVEGDGCPSVKGVIPTKFGESICFCGIDGARLILVSVCGNSGLVPIKYLLPHQLYVHDVQKLSEQGEVLVCAVPVYDQQINVTSALPSAPSQEVAGS